MSTGYLAPFNPKSHQGVGLNHGAPSAIKSYGATVIWEGPEDEVLIAPCVVVEGIAAVAEVVEFVAEPVEDVMPLLAPAWEVSLMTPQADGLSQLDAINSTEETAARFSLMEGSRATLAKVTWLVVHPEAQLDTDEDTVLPEAIDDVLMAGFELDGFALVIVPL